MLRGVDSTHAPKPDDDKKEEEKKNDDDKKEIEKEKKEEKKEADEDDDDKPSKIYDTIHIIGTQRTMGKVVHTAELVKRIIGGLHQVTSLTSIQIVDCM